MTVGEAPRKYDDLIDLVEDALETLARRRAKYAGDDFAAMSLLASLIDYAEQVLADRVRGARADGRTWHEIADALATSPVEVCIKFGHCSSTDRSWLHDR